MSLNALQLSPQQNTELRGGTADFAANLPPVFLSDDYPVDTDLLARIGRVETALTVPVRSDGTPVVNEYGRTVSIRESVWNPNPYPDAIRLTAGRFPDAPGELVVSDALSTDLSIGEEAIPALGSSENAWVVVGSFVNDFRSDAREILAGAGTLTTLPERYFSLRQDAAFTSTLYWNGDDPRPIVNQIVEQQNILDAYVGNFNSAPNPLFYDRAEALSKDRYSVNSRAIEYAIPAAVLPVVFSIFAVVLVLAWLRHSEIVFEKAGVRKRAVFGGFLVACAAGITVFVVGGVIVGAIAGYLIRPALSSWVHRVLSPVVWPFGQIPALMFLSLCGVIVGAAALYPRAVVQARTKKKHKTFLPRVMPYAAVIGLLGFGGVAVWILIRGYRSETYGPTQYEQSGFAVIFLTACAASLLLLVSPLAVKRIGMRGLFVGRILTQERLRTSFIVLLLTIAVATPLMLSTTAPLVKQMSNMSQLAEIPSGYVELVGGLDSAQTIDTAEINDFEVTTGLKDPIDVYSIGYSSQNAPDESVFVMVGTEPKIGSIRALRNEADVEILTGSPLTDTQRQLLRAGGILGDFFTGTDAIVRTTTTKEPPTSEMLPAMQVSIPREFAFGSNIHGLVLLATAIDHSWPVSAPRAMYSGVTDQQSSEVRDYIELNGRFVNLSLVVNRTQDTIPVPTSLQLVVWMMGILVVLLSLSVSRSVVRRLRPILRSLHAAGVRENWIRNSVGLYLLPILLISLLFGELAGYLSVWVITTFNQESTTEAVVSIPIPWSIYGIVAASFAAGAIVSYGIVGRGLAARSQSGNRFRKQSRRSSVVTPEGAENVRA